MAEKILNTRIQLKIDTLENWKSSTLKIKNGEVCFATLAAEAGTGLEEPVVMMKVGTSEEKTFSELPWAFYAKSSDVLAACKTEAGLKAFVNGVIADAGIASDDAMQELAGKVTVADGKITTLEGKMTTAEGKISANEKAIETIEGRFGAETVALEISAAINALNLAGTYEAKGEAAKVQTALNEYKTSNDAAVQANANAADANAKAIAAIKDGTTIDSFKDVEDALAGKETSGAAAQALVDAKAYADGLAGNYDAKGAAATAESNAKAYAKEYADGLAGNYDAAGSASAAETAAKGYTDSELTRLVGDKTVGTQISETIANYSTTTQMNTAIATAKGEAVAHADGLNTAMNTRVEALEAIDHTHTFVESELNLIQAGDVAKWNAAEQNAKTYADGLNTAMDSRVEALEAKFTGDDSVADQIADAVAGEATLREAADAGLQEQITANANAIDVLEGYVGGKKVSEAIDEAVKVEADRAKGVEAGLETRLKVVEDTYATDDDIAGLQTQINTIMNNPDTKDVIDSIAEFTQYVADHGTIAEGMRNDINKNTTDLAAEVKRAGEAEAELEGAINGVAADLETLSGVVDTKAAQADLEDLDGRVEVVEGKVATLEGKMDTAQADIETLEGYVGGKKVSDAISEAIEAALKVEGVDKYALASALADAIAQHATDKKALEDAIALKANDADLAAIAKTGNVNDLVQTTGDVLIFDCGGAN